MKLTRIVWFFLAALALSVLVFAQEAAPVAVAAVEAAAEPVLKWGPIAAAGIGVLVMLFVQLVGAFVPRLDSGVKMVIAAVASPALTWLATFVANAIGYPVDFSTLIDALAAATGSGLSAMGAFDVLKKLGVLGAGK